MSDTSLEEAQRPSLSTTGKADCMLEAGYFAVLRCLGGEAHTCYVEHPSTQALQDCGLNVDVALKHLRARLEAPGQVVDVHALTSWALEMRWFAGR